MEVRSILGALLTLMVKIMLLIYFGYKANFLIIREGQQITEHIEPNVYSLLDNFGVE